ncbi:Kaptin [Paragonimus westermani]|uniref:Kaptin n=1 Tax=Paragonimus westermani TaxID=34504 RepID=A0A8T0DBV7_9TREM|nr:Kaptin [Paragonimus westermani]
MSVMIIKPPMEMPMEALYFPSQAQSNAYNMTFVKSSIPAENSFSAVLKYDLLVAYYRPVADSLTTKECFVLYRFSSDSHGVNTVLKSLDFVYLPGDCNIACINALQDCLTGEYIVGIGFVTVCTLILECHLRYSELAYVPLQLKHTYYISPTTLRLQWAFVLSCGRPFCVSTLSYPTPSALTKELPIRIFAQLCDCVDESEGAAPYNSFSTESVSSVYGEFNSKSSLKYFPELSDVPNIMVLHMDFVIQQADSLTRLSAFGAENGWFGVFQTDMEHEVVLKRIQFTHDSAITHIQLFHPCASSKVNNDSVDPSISAYQPDDMDLLVCSSHEPAVVYRHVLRLNSLGVNNQLILPQSADYDNVNCASVGDFDFDGRQELVLGTFGQRLLFYRWNSTESSTTHKSLGSYSLVAKRTLIAPIHSISPSLDLTGEGVDSLAVLTSRGLHIYRHKTSDVISLLSARLSKESL